MNGNPPLTLLVSFYARLDAVVVLCARRNVVGSLCARLNAVVALCARLDVVASLCARLDVVVSLYARPDGCWFQIGRTNTRNWTAAAGDPQYQRRTECDTDNRAFTKCTCR